MSFWTLYKQRKAVRLFESGMLRCERCRTRLKLENLQPLTLVGCSKCRYLNFVPHHVAGLWLYQPLGGGGIGSVFKAYHPELRMTCAVKVLHRNTVGDPESVAVLMREAEAMETIGEHPCIVRLVSKGFTDGEHYCVFEYIEGERLDWRIAELACMPWENAVGIVQNLLSAEKHIYARGFLYRDIKAENVIIKKSGQPVLLDFGLCIPIEEARSGSEEELIDGSAFYLPPERLVGDSEGPASEIYSLGMLMYVMLTGESFFKSTKSVEDLSRKHIASLRLSVTPSLIPHCSPALVEILDRMIKKQPDKRFQTFEEVEQAFVSISAK